MCTAQKTFLLSLLAGGLLLTACEGNKAEARASSLAEVTSIHVEAKSCRSGIQQALAERGLGVTQAAEKADSRLQVKVVSEGRNLDEIPEFGGFGSKASYNATLYGADDSVLFSTAGEEGSTTYEELCEDIGDEVAERIQDKRNV